MLHRWLGTQRILRATRINNGLHQRGLSSRWKAQRDADIYADRAIDEGMRSRAAYKLEEMNKKFNYFLRPVRHNHDNGVEVIVCETPKAEQSLTNNASIYVDLQRVRMWWILGQLQEAFR